MPAKKDAAVVEEEAQTALVPVAESATDVVASKTAFSTDIDFDAEDVTYPRLKLLQGISPEVMDPESNLKAGQWHITGDDAGRKVVVFIPLGFTLSRRFEIGTGEDKQLACSSSDGKTGHAYLPVGPGGACKGCAMSQWAENPDTGKRFLACQPTYNYVGYVPGFGVVQLSLSRTATQTAKTLNGFLQMRGFGTFAVSLAASIVQGGDKTYFVPQMKMAKVDPEEFENARMMIGG